MKSGIRLGRTTCPETVAGFLAGWGARTLALLLLTMSAMGQAEGYYYTAIDDDSACIITYYTGPGGAVTIPSAINNLPVVSIAGGAFYQNYSLTSVTIPNSGITNIGEGAFYGCISLASVTIPNSVTYIGYEAFMNCYSLTNVAIGNGVTYIEAGAFEGCRPISLTIGNGATSIASMEFMDWAILTSVTISSRVANIGEWAFLGCTGLTSVAIPDSVTSIGDSAFGGCSGLSNVAIDNGVTNIGQGAFLGCTGLTAITVDALNSFYGSAAGVLFNKSQTTLIQYPQGKAASNYTIPNSVTDIGRGSFANCTSLASVTIPNGVTNIGEGAFEECGLTSVSIPNSVISIGDGAFFGCRSLASVTMGKSVTNILDDAFAYCAGLNSVYFQGNAPSVGTDVFYDDNLTVYYLPGTSGWRATFGGRPTVLWNPQVGTRNARFGVGTNGFGFIVARAYGSIVVEGCTNLASPAWYPLQTNTLSSFGGGFYFSDPQWTNYASRFYRVSWP
jgi:hypothetical protein